MEKKFGFDRIRTRAQCYRQQYPGEGATDNLSYVEEPVRIADYRIKQLRNREIPMVKVVWKNHGVEEATWETEEKMKRDYPQLFHDPGK